MCTILLLKTFLYQCSVLQSTQAFLNSTFPLTLSGTSLLLTPSHSRHWTALDLTHTFPQHFTALDNLLLTTLDCPQYPPAVNTILASTLNSPSIPTSQPQHPPSSMLLQFWLTPTMQAATTTTLVSDFLPIRRFILWKPTSIFFLSFLSSVHASLWEIMCTRRSVTSF